MSEPEEDAEQGYTYESYSEADTKVIGLDNARTASFRWGIAIMTLGLLLAATATVVVVAWALSLVISLVKQQVNANWRSAVQLGVAVFAICVGLCGFVSGVLSFTKHMRSRIVLGALYLIGLVLLAILYFLNSVFSSIWDPDLSLSLSNRLLVGIGGSLLTLVLCGGFIICAALQLRAVAVYRAFKSTFPNYKVISQHD